MATKYKTYDVEALYKGVLNADRAILSRAITLVESTREDHQNLATELIQKCLPHAGNAQRIGISGSPGVGKSTFIEYLGSLLTSNGEKLAVLTIDPSSQLTKGSILGDKTRMEKLTRNKDVFIRPSASGSTLGGVARKTREAMILCEAAGFQKIIIETVGVGQSEVAVRQMVDCFVLLLLPGAGDDLQGIKKGIMEIADAILINKSDGDNKSLAQRTVGFYASALHLMRPRSDQWQIPVKMCSALTGTGMDEVVKVLEDYFETQASSILDKRKDQAQYWFESAWSEALKRLFMQTPGMQEEYASLKNQVLAEDINAFQAVDILIKYYRDKLKSDD